MLRRSCEASSDSSPACTMVDDGQGCRSSTLFKHYVYRNDPLELKLFVDKRVELTTTDRSTPHRGYVYTVDPVTGSYVLYSVDDHDQLKVEIIPGHTVEAASVIVLPDDGNDDDGHRSSCAAKLRCLLESTPSSRGTLKSVDEVVRKRTVAAWLRRHLIPVADGVDDPSTLTIMNALTIKPPYTADNCYGENEIILGKVQGLLKSMPKHWNEDDCSQ